MFLNGFIQVKMLAIIEAEAGKPPLKKSCKYYKKVQSHGAGGYKNHL